MKGMLKFMAKSTWVIAVLTAASWWLYKVFVKELLPDYIAGMVAGIEKLEKR